MTTRLSAIISLLFIAVSATAQDNIPEMQEIPAGYFWMGSSGWGHDYDEAPVHKVVISKDFRMSATEITNAQYEQFRPEHHDARGKSGFSFKDDEAVTDISYFDAVAYCEWLSAKTGRNFRLPTEAEWEYACRAGTYTLYYTGDGLSEAMQKNQKTERELVPVSLKVRQSEPNAFGLYDMHGNVEEWCLDWYGEYSDKTEVDPAGPSTGIYKVTRGGSHNTPHEFLRSANRSAAIPEDKHHQIGFRIVESDVAPAFRISGNGIAKKISQKKYGWKATNDEPLWIPPVPYIHTPDDGTPFYRHNHQPAVTWCDNGDLLAIWFSCDAESGREMVVLSSRLRKGADTWEKPELFFKVPDRNMTGSSLTHLPDGRIMHMNGVGDSGDWKRLAMAVRFSSDNGATWSSPTLAAPEHTVRHQVIAGAIVTTDGRIIQCCDAGPGGHDGTAVHISDDGGISWNDPWDGDLPEAEEMRSRRATCIDSALSEITDGGRGTTAAGIHAGIVELRNGSLMTLGRGNSIVDSDGKKRMPMSISRDGGRTWTYSATEFTPIDGGQRLVLMRLQEGPIMLVSFTDHPQRTPVEDRGIDFKDGRGYGMFVAISYDEGKTWPVKKLMTDGVERMLDGGAWTKQFIMNEHNAEPRGYLAGTQSPDGVIHILSSRLHYRFNLAWIEKE